MSSSSPGPPPPPRPDKDGGQAPAEITLTCPTCGGHDVFKIPGHHRLRQFECRSCEGRW